MPSMEPKLAVAKLKTKRKISKYWGMIAPIYLWENRESAWFGSKRLRVRVSPDRLDSRRCQMIACSYELDERNNNGKV